MRDIDLLLGFLMEVLVLMGLFGDWFVCVWWGIIFWLIVKFLDVLCKDGIFFDLLLMGCINWVVLGVFLDKIFWDWFGCFWR